MAGRPAPFREIVSATASAREISPRSTRCAEEREIVMRPSLPSRLSRWRLAISPAVKEVGR